MTGCTWCGHDDHPPGGCRRTISVAVEPEKPKAYRPIYESKPGKRKTVVESKPCPCKRGLA